MEVIRLESISKAWPGVKALDDVSFSVNKGTIHGFLGPNGAGKSTTLNILTGLIPQTSGDIDINGTIGFLPEHPPLYSNMVVMDYLKFVSEIYKIPKNEIQDRIKEASEKCGLALVEKRLIRNLSKGYKQRVALAQAIIHKPDIIILDEPTVGLDPNSVMELRNLILGLKESHTILFSSHQLSEVDKICDDLTIINNGQVLKSGPKDQIKKMFSSKQVVIAELLKWNDEVKLAFEEAFSPDRIEENGNGNNPLIKIYLKSTEDKREEISRFIVEKGLGLISLSEEKLDLEDIFKQVTQG